VATLVWIVVFIGASPHDLETPPESTVAFGIYMGVMTLIMCAAFVAFVMLQVHLRRIARRSIKKGLAKLATALIWESVGMVGMVGILSAVTFLALRSFAVATRVPVTTTMPAGWPPPASAPGVPYSSPVQVGGLGYAAPTTMPAGVTFTPATMPAGGPPMVFPPGLRLLSAVACLGNVLELAWFVCIVVGMFWFRVTLSRAIRDNAFHTLPVV
jgi:hypothetical protein